ncbi:MAG: ATP-binding cassette domain-containing protein [Methylotenera sp.]|uniref:sulfate/molybdate ABC transporter ATP-binding protein n=1 Tax=Methylotenera sp. TaxID=2051956 RepID=UPI002487AB29|nr:ATP-binding cassette domain-containing protein [Methylotenera sp.]MDI1310418.1 ATP-binding cassette domain-containing protein [Methylotenera sp.]
MIKAQINKRLIGANGSFELDVELQIAKGEFVALYGPSGVGKTTLLRCLAGLEQADQANIKFNGNTWVDTRLRINLEPQLRRVGYMFQDYALFPNMTVRGNVEFALRKGSSTHRINELIELMNLGELQHQKPETLSGGQKQRVALARALASEPSLLLLDEPFSALDTEMRSRLHNEVLRLQRSLGITTIIVSHDVSEVYKLAKRVFVMEAGRIAQHGTPADVFSAGQTSGKFRFTGEILALEPMDVLYSLTVLVGNQIVRVVAMPEEALKLSVGDAVMLVSKAFNPMILKLE